MARLHLVQFQLRHASASIAVPRIHLGVQLGSEVADLTQILPQRFQNMRAVLAEGRRMTKRIAELLPKAPRVPLTDVRLRAPIQDPSKVLCIGLNYRDHATESKMQLPKEPLVFAKFPNAIVGPDDEIVCPSYAAAELDYEVEMVLVMGMRAHQVAESTALQYVAGITVGNDVSARDWQLKRGGGQWSMGKSFDTFAPIGPAIVTLDELLTEKLSTLDISCTLNGKCVQHSNTKQMLFSPAALVSYLSQIMTLEPGDLIFTGTPPGVGLGRTPPLWLKQGDVVTCELEEVGYLTNHVVVSPATVL